MRGKQKSAAANQLYNWAVHANRVSRKQLLEQQRLHHRASGLPSRESALCLSCDIFKQSGQHDFMVLKFTVWQPSCPPPRDQRPPNGRGWESTTSAPTYHLFLDQTKRLRTVLSKRNEDVFQTKVIFDIPAALGLIDRVLHHLFGSILSSIRSLMKGCGPCGCGSLKAMEYRG